MLSLKIKETKEKGGEEAFKGTSPASALENELKNISLSRRNTQKFDPEENLLGTPKGYSFAGNPLVDYATSMRSTRDQVEIVPRSLEEAAFSTTPVRAGAGAFQASDPILSPCSLKSNFLSEDVIQALPKPLEPAERERKIRESKQTPTFELVRKVNKYKELINSPSSEGQTLRRQLLSGAVVVIICAGYSGKRFIYERAKELGVRIVIIDGPDSWSQTLVEEGVIENFVGLDMSDPTAVFKEALGILKDIDKEIGGIDGICTFWEVAVPLVARLTESLGLPGNSSAAVDTARDKFQTRKRLKEANLPTPSSAMVYSKEDLDQAAATVGFPAVLKPINGAASLGVVKVVSKDELEKVYSSVLTVLKTCTLLDVNGVEEGHGGESFMNEVMMEQYLDGDEVDVDIILSNGEATYAKVTDNLPTLEPWFNETGACTPSILPQSKQDDLVKTSLEMLKAIGLTSGVMHVELKYTTQNGPQLIEVNTRMGGGPVRNMNLDVWGVDLIEAQLMTSVGLPALPPIPSEPLRCQGQYSVNAKMSGTMGNEFEGVLDDVRKLPDVVLVEALAKPGDRVVCIQDGMPTWIADIIVEKATAEEALEYVQKIAEEMDQPIYK
jgi:carnosine synthase